jgi:hypothetical protein
MLVAVVKYSWSLRFSNFGNGCIETYPKYDCLQMLNKLSLLDVEAMDKHASFY